MFDISWSELLILGLVTLIFVGPKELPKFLNTLGRYAGAMRRQANEFRAVFEQAMREAEMDQIQKEVRSVGEGMKASFDAATQSVESARASANVQTIAKPRPAAAGDLQGAADSKSADGVPEDDVRQDAPTPAPVQSDPSSGAP